MIFKPGDRVLLRCLSKETWAQGWDGLPCVVIDHYPGASKALPSGRDGGNYALLPLEPRPDTTHQGGDAYAEFWWDENECEAAIEVPTFTSVEQAQAWLDQHQSCATGADCDQPGVTCANETVRVGESD